MPSSPRGRSSTSSTSSSSKFPFYQENKAVVARKGQEEPAELVPQRPAAERMVTTPHRISQLTASDSLGGQQTRRCKIKSTRSWDNHCSVCDRDFDEGQTLSLDRRSANARSASQKLKRQSFDQDLRLRSCDSRVAARIRA